jgi:hypothetical protein
MPGTDSRVKAESSRARRLAGRGGATACISLLAAAGTLVAASSTSARTARGGSDPPARAAAHQESIDATYSGRVAEVVTFDYGAAGTNTIRTRYTFVSTEDVVDPAKDPRVTKHLHATGTETITGTGSRASLACSAQLRANGLPAAHEVLFKRLEETRGEVTASPYLPGAGDVVSTGSGACGELEISPPFTRDQAFLKVLNPTVHFPTKAREINLSYDVKYPGGKGGATKNDNGIKITETIDIQAKLAVVFHAG